MIPVAPAPKPPGFDHEVRVPGLRSVYEMAGRTPPTQLRRTRGRPFTQRHREVQLPNGKCVRRPVTRPGDLPADEMAPFWRLALDDLRVAYGSICAYSCFRIHPVTGSATVDHMVPRSLSWRGAYEWNNFRLACLDMNARKGDSLDVLDPFEVGATWFALELVGGQVVAGAGARRSRSMRWRVDRTIEVLNLNDQTLRGARLSDLEGYLARRFGYAHLQRESPFVARELRRQGKLLPEDAL